MRAYGCGRIGCVCLVDVVTGDGVSLTSDGYKQHSLCDRLFWCIAVVIVVINDIIGCLCRGGGTETVSGKSCQG